MSLKDLLLGASAKSNKPLTKEIKRSGNVTATPFRAVSILPGKVSCAAAKIEQQTKRLARNTPTLPLPNCTMSDRCQCHFAKFSDRRDGDRRALGGDMRSAWYSGGERRKRSRRS